MVCQPAAFSSTCLVSPNPNFENTKLRNDSLLLELGIFTSHILFLLRTRSLRRLAKETNTPFDDMPEARKFVFPRPPLSESSNSASTTMEDVNANVDVDIEKGGREGTTCVTQKETDIGKEVGGERERRRSSVSAAGVGRWPSRT